MLQTISSVRSIARPPHIPILYHIRLIPLVSQLTGLFLKPGKLRGQPHKGVDLLNTVYGLLQLSIYLNMASTRLW